MKEKSFFLKSGVDTYLSMFKSNSSQNYVPLDYADSLGQTSQYQS